MDVKYLLKLSRLLKLVVEMPTDRGILVAQAESFQPGTDVYIQDENGDLIVPENGNYVATTSEGEIAIVIEAGKIVSMEHTNNNPDATKTEENLENQEGSDNGSDTGSDNGSDNGEEQEKTNNEGSDNGSDNGNSEDGTDTTAKMEDEAEIDALKAEIEAKDARIAELEAELAELKAKIDEVDPSAEEAEKFQNQKPSDKRMEKIQKAIDAVKLLKKQ